MAHIMTYEELRNIKKGELIFEQIKHKNIIIPLIYNGCDFTTDGLPWEFAKHYLLLEECDDDCPDYRWNYRCWNEHPTKEEIDTPWKENPYEENE